MSIIPASRLSSSDLRHLGNNLRPRRPRFSPRRRSERHLVATVNRSLGCVGEAISRLDMRPSVVALCS